MNKLIDAGSGKIKKIRKVTQIDDRTLEEFNIKLPWGDRIFNMHDLGKDLDKMIKDAKNGFDQESTEWIGSTNIENLHEMEVIRPDMIYVETMAMMMFYKNRTYSVKSKNFQTRFVEPKGYDNIDLITHAYPSPRLIDQLINYEELASQFNENVHQMGLFIYLKKKKKENRKAIYVPMFSYDSIVPKSQRNQKYHIFMLEFVSDPGYSPPWKDPYHTYINAKYIGIYNFWSHFSKGLEQAIEQYGKGKTHSFTNGTQSTGPK